MGRRGIEDEEGVTRRSFLRGAVATGTAGFLGVATYGTVRSLISPPPIVKGEILDTFIYVKPEGARLPVWYVERDLAGQEARLSHFDTGKGANVLWKAVVDDRGSLVPFTGLPGLLLQMDDETLDFPGGYPRDTFVMQGLYAVFNCCPHACCRPGWQLLPRSAYKLDLGHDTVYCPCHDSQYDPQRFSRYQHPQPPDASGAEYVGVYKEPGVGPADRGMPLIPLELEGDKLVGALKDLDWYRYLDFKRTSLEED